MKRYIKIAQSLIALLCYNLSYSATTFSGAFTQGAYIIGHTNPGATVVVNNQTVKLTPSGEFVFGISSNRKKDMVIAVNNHLITKSVTQRQYKIQRINGLKKNKVTPPNKLLKRIHQEQSAITQARSINSNLNDFDKPFINPLSSIRITGVYGSRRILNDIEKSPHYGLDFAAARGTPVKVVLPGKITLAQPDYFYTGGTIIVDHGHGVSSLYMHLHRLMVKKGDSVAQGQTIGAVGSTGRSTGPHLDIRLNWFQTKLDPALVLPLNKS
jgi:murein DD-endopeptidase MepM/ murein hydrolase activator NlpD